ncbi:MAG: hypothetical protein K2K97_01020, partial [Muribaculaceae bacterium]|nr:hypothetical protein [Muribaculaceae bacterium]
LILTYQGPSGLVPLGSTMRVKFKNLSGVEDITADSEIGLVYDRCSAEASITSPTEIRSVEAYDITGRRTDTATSLNGNNAFLKLKGSGIGFIKVVNVAGEVKLFKILL